MRLIEFSTCIFMVMAVCFVRADTELQSVWVTTSGSVDTRTPQSIVNSLVKPGMSDEEKALSIFHWYRRVIYPHNYLAEDRREILRQVNSYGNTLCGSHAANLSWLMREAGFKTRCVFINNGGHTFLDVWYEDAWHSLDPETDFAVWSRGDKPHLINMDELKEDPTLLDNAEAEGRARPWLFKAMKFPWATRAQLVEFCDAHKCNKSDMAWSSGVLKGETLKEFFVHGVQTVKYTEDNATNGGHIRDPNLMEISLKPNETLIRYWDNEGKGKYIFGQGYLGYPAHLLYGGRADESDEIVFPFVEPYRKDNYGTPDLPVDRCYRYSGNGHLIWKPDMTANELISAPGVKTQNLIFDKTSGMLRPEKANAIGLLTVPIKSSYALACATIDILWLKQGGEGIARLMVKLPKKNPVEIWKLAEQGSDIKAKVFYDKEINRMYDYELIIEMSHPDDANKIGLKNISLDHTFVNNWLALPYLVPGANTLQVSLKNPETLNKTKLFVKLEWDEGEQWADSKMINVQITKSPQIFDINVKGPKYPRMKSVALTAVP